MTGRADEPSTEEPADAGGSGVRAGVVRPRDAASLVLVKRTAEGPAILMGRRPPRSVFIPDAFVFPGGKVDADDARVRSEYGLHEDAERVLQASAGGSTRRARALAHAVIRETYEETGLMVAREGWLDAPDDGTWRDFLAAGCAPDPSGLRLVARAITPTSSERRFHARFFLAEAEAARGELVQSEELLDLDWYPLARARALPTIDVTQIVMEVVASLVDEQGVPSAGQPKSVTFVSYRGHAPIVRQE